MKWLDKTLTELETYAAGLSIEKGRQGNQGPRPKGFESTTPARDDVVVALDYRSHGGAGVHRLRDPRDMSDTPIRSILGSLHGLAEWIRDERQQDPNRSPTIASEVRYLKVQLDWCARQTKVHNDQAHPYIDELADDIRELFVQVRMLSGFKPTRLGVCRFSTKRGECGGEVYSYGDHIKCLSCNRKIDRKDWGRAEDMG